MDLIKRTATAAVLLGVLFVIVQYAPRAVFFLFGQVFIVAALLEFYSLNAKKDLAPQKALGVVLALVVGASFFFRAVPLEAALFACLLVAGVYFVAATGTAAKLDRFPAAFAVTLVGVFYIAFPLNFLYRIRLEMGPLPLYFLFAVIFLGDTGAFFIGKPFGRHKMTPIASPNKSWEGSAGGILFALAAAALSRWLFLPEVPLCDGPPDRRRRPRRRPGQRSAGVPVQACRRGQGFLQRPARPRRLLRPHRQPDPGRPALLFHRLHLWK